MTWIRVVSVDGVVRSLNGMHLRYNGRREIRCLQQKERLCHKGKWRNRAEEVGSNEIFISYLDVGMLMGVVQ